MQCYLCSMVANYANTAPQLGIKPKAFNFNLEVLRGIAALVVAWHHLIIMPNVLGLAPAGIWAFSPPGHLCVLIFFVLSGYVIGLAHPEPLTRQGMGLYLKKRALRLYPIYFVAIAFTFWLAPISYPSATILSHFALTQVWLSPVVVENSPVWSLHYEVLYYLIFIPLSFFRIPVRLALGLSFGLGFANAYLLWVNPTAGASPLLSSYAFGFTFWLSGLALAQYRPKAVAQASWAEMLSLLFLLLAMDRFNVLATLLRTISLSVLGTDLKSPASVLWFHKVIDLQDFATLPFCLLTLVVFAGKDVPGRRPFATLLILFPVLTFYYLYHHYDSQVSWALLIPTLSYLLAVATYLFRHRLESLSERLVKRLVITGSLSYGIYIVHYPLFKLFNQTHLFAGTVPLVLVRLGLVSLLVVGFAYLLEKKFQPWIKKRVRLVNLPAAQSLPG